MERLRELDWVCDVFEREKGDTVPKGDTERERDRRTGAPVPIPMALVEPRELEQPAGPVTRSRARELAQADMVPSGAESQAEAQEGKFAAAAAGSSLQRAK